jgi:lambda repressor-like predicted transcriptional regulator
MKKDEESLSVNDYRFNYRQTGDELFSESHFSAPNPIVARQMFDLACKKDDLVADEVGMAVWNRWANRWEEVSTEEFSDTD